MWPDAWVFFHGVPQQAVQAIEFDVRMAGVVTRRTVDKTIELARRLQPNARRLLVVAGEAEPEKEAVEGARGASAGLPEVEFSFGLPLPELVQRVAQEPADGIVVYYAHSRDREGRPYVPRDVLRAVAAASRAPVYGTFETYLGEGIAAGVVETYTNRGRLVAERLIQLAAGETIPVLSTVPDFCAADSRAAAQVLNRRVAPARRVRNTLHRAVPVARIPVANPRRARRSTAPDCVDRRLAA